MAAVRCGERGTVLRSAGIVGAAAGLLKVYTEIPRHESLRFTVSCASDSRPPGRACITIRYRARADSASEQGFRMFFLKRHVYACSWHPEARCLHRSLAAVLPCTGKFAVDLATQHRSLDGAHRWKGGPCNQFCCFKFVPRRVQCQHQELPCRHHCAPSRRDGYCVALGNGGR